MFLKRQPSGEWATGKLRPDPGESRAGRIIAEEWSRLGWTEEELGRARQNAPGKMGIATRLRRATTLPLKWIAVRIGLGTSKSANARLHQWLRNHPNPTSAASAPLNQPSPTILNQECARGKNHAMARPFRMGRARQNAPGKMAIAARLRRATTLPLKWIAVRIGLRTSPSANARLHQWMRNHPNPTSASSAPLNQPSPTILNQECARKKPCYGLTRSLRPPSDWDYTARRTGPRRAVM